MPVARVQLPDGRIGRFEVPEGTTPEQVQAFASAQKAPEQEGFLSRVGRQFTEAQQRRGAQLADVFTGEGAAEQTFPETLLQVAGTEIGATADIAGQAISETVRAGFAALPEETQQGLRSLGTEFLESSVGQAGVQALQSGAEAFEAFEKENPRAGRNIRSVVNVALFATPVKGVSGAILAERGAEAFGAVIPSVAGSIARGAEAVAGGVARGAEAVVEKVAQTGEVATRLATGIDADKLLANRINVTDATEALKELKSGEISVLADVAGDEIQGFTRAVGKVSGGARNIVSEALEGRSQEAVGRVINSLSKNISNVDTYFGNLDDIAKARSSVAAPLYAKAYGEAVDIDRPKLNKLLQDQRIITALDDAKANLGVRLEVPANSLEALDGAKKSLDDIIGTAKRAGQNQKAASFIKLKTQLIDVLDEASPTYKKARQVFSDFSSIKNAQEIGLDFTKQTPEQIKRTLSTMSNTQKEAFKIGVRENLQRVVSKTADQADPAKRVFGNQFKRNQIKAVFGEGKQINEFTRKMNEEIRAAKTKFRVLGGSRTDINIADDGQFINAASRAATQGFLRTSIDTVVDSVASAAKRRWTGLNNRNATQLAKILTDRDAGIEALEKLIQNASKEQKLLLRDAVQELGK